MVCVCVCVREYTQALFTACNHKPPFSHSFLTPPCTGTNVNVSPTITPPLTPALPSPSFSLLPLRHLLPAIYRRPSISPACQRAFSFGLLLQGARRWQITTRQPVIFDLSEPPSLCAPLLSRPHSLPSPASIQTHSNSSSPQCPTHLHPPLFPPTNHIFLLRSVQKI